MSGSRWAVVVASVASSMALAGCVDVFGGESLDTFDPVPVPGWEPGYWWTYDVATTTQQAYTFAGEEYEQGPRQDHEVVTVRVFNTTAPLNGESVYYLRNDNPVDSPLLEASVQALTQDSLALAGVGDTYFGRVAVVEPISMPASPHGLYDAAPTQTDAPPEPCAGRGQVDPVAAQDRFEQFQFPMQAGAKWSGVWVVPSENVQIRYTATIDGMETVSTPAGTFDAVRTTIDMVPAIPVLDEDLVFDARLRVQNWYAPEVEYIVKSVTETKIKAVGPGGESFRAEYQSVQELREWSLVPGAPEPAPYVRQASFPPGVDDTFRIVSDHAAPVNVADGPFPVRFALEDAPSESGRYSFPIENATGVQPYNPGGDAYEVVWRLTWSGGSLWHVGDTLDVDLDKASVYSVDVEVRPVECGLPRMATAHGDFPVFWARTFLVRPGPLDDGPFLLDEVEVLGGPQDTVATWSWSPMFGAQVDDGHPRLVGPSGPNEGYESASGETAFNIYPGTWSLQWVPDSPTVGDEVEVTFRIDFGTSYH